MVTELGIMRFGEDKRMYLSEYFPGINVEQIIKNTGFMIDVSRAVEADPPDREVLNILMNKVDPMRIMT